MRTLLLAAGVGSRLRPLTDTIPKCLVPIHGRPLLAYWLDLLFLGGIDRALINTHHLADKVRSFVMSSPWRERIDLVKEDILLGTGGTIVANRTYFGRGPLLVAHADNLTNLDLRSFVAAHATRPDGCVLTMLAFRTDDPKSCGILELNQAGTVCAFHEKVEAPPGNLANAAVYILEPEIIDYALALNKPILDFQTEIIPAFLDRIYAVEHRGYHRDIGNLESLRRAQIEFPKPAPYVCNRQPKTHARALSAPEAG
jgi:mannose-1-phosphate guanylyltransferase